MRGPSALIRLVWLPVLAGLGGCGADPDPLPDPLAYLRVGVEPAAEAERVVASLRRGGYREVRRSVGRRHVAVEMRHRERGTSAVRIVTERGTAVALDDPLGELQLADLEPARLRDLDRDGEAEVLVSRPDPALGRTCILTMKVGIDGRVVVLPIELSQFADRLCIERLEDTDGDGRAEAWTTIRLLELAHGDRVPRADLPLELRNGSWLPGPPRLLREVVDSLSAEIVEAWDADSAEAVYCTAVALAVVAGIMGEDAGAQQGILGAAVEGMELPESVAESLQRAREHLGGEAEAAP